MHNSIWKSAISKSGLFSTEEQSNVKLKTSDSDHSKNYHEQNRLQSETLILIPEKIRNIEKEIQEVIKTSKIFIS